jgi:branched-chain amino acid transport system ATP-binding protein
MYTSGSPDRRRPAGSRAERAEEAEGGAMLEVRDLVVGYGKIEAVHGVSFGVDEGEVGILGANGAGKSTILGEAAR